MTEEEALDCLQRGLHPTVHVYVITYFPTTADEAMRLALAYESSSNQNTFAPLVSLPWTWMQCIQEEKDNGVHLVAAVPTGDNKMVVTWIMTRNATIVAA
ncbi:hypothetical protein BDB00DRAFT_869740 [Zychaea mexicana]|uniref:uncharacterized protein n=1 Tax=Zychaea mexicana TaxID=64656 RepID=UPI0022FE4824|nr:uncharacterized protein BDB00DRAFT_869740 [Zychaea mexicana]KAI9496110.1 hypothetical protein BDB00DRAFT_869740 [Zychaea mexicana]